MAERKTEAVAAMRGQRSLSNVGALMLGMPLGLGILAAISMGPLKDSEIQRYVEHPAEQVEVVLFCCALGALLTKALGQMGERSAFRRLLLPAWNGQPVPADQAGPLLDKFRSLGRRLHNTCLVRRVTAVLDFVRGRGSANQLDDQIRALADNDAIALESSYALLRLIVWAIPILGFLGTVLGITQAISGVSPDDMNMGKVTGGLSQAFDTTALALGLTMIVMFVNFLVDRLEQRTLEAVDRYVDDHLAHRFERTGPDTGGMGSLVRQNSLALIKSMEGLVEQQAEIWTRSMEKAEARWAEAGLHQQEMLTTALQDALERTLTGYNQRLMEVEKQAVDRSRALYEGLTGLAAVLRDTGREHQQALAQVGDRLASQAESLARIQEGEAHLLRLQESLQQNLAALAGAGTFDQAVHSLTAAIHLLTARTGTAANLRLGSLNKNAA